MLTSYVDIEKTTEVSRHTVRVSITGDYLQYVVVG
jgi:hypothetical protein